MEAQIMAILNDICGAEEGEIEPDMNLFEEGLLDSFAVLELLVNIEQTLAIALDIATLTREEIETPAKLIARVAKAR